MIAPAVVDWNQGGPGAQVFAVTAAGTIVLGLLVMLATRHRQATLMLEQAFLLTSGLWLVLPLAGALPLMIGAPGLSFTDAVFESMSGLTTTGTTGAFLKVDSDRRDAVADPRRPADARDLAPFWRKRGYAPIEGALCEMSWKEIGGSEKVSHPMQFWMRAL